MATKKKIPGAPIFGGAVQLSALPTGKSEGEWNVLAYEVNLPGHGDGARLTRSDFEQMIGNFKRYPKVPVVIEHADTDWFGDREHKEPHGWITALKIDDFTRAEGQVVAALYGRMSLDKKTRTEVNGDDENPAKWPFGSITCFQGTDAETEKGVGMCLWSYSLTAHPALIDVPKLVAGAIGPRVENADQLAELFGGSAEQYAALFDLGGPLHVPAPTGANDSPVPPTTSLGVADGKDSIPMIKFLALAATLGLTAKDEPEAETAVVALATEAADVRRALGSKSPAETAAKLSTLTTQAAQVETLSVENKGFRKERDERDAKERAEHVDAVLLGMGLEDAQRERVKASLTLHAKADWPGFQKAYPKPASTDVDAEGEERGQDAQRFQRVSSKGRSTAPASVGGPAANDIISAAHAVMASAEQQGSPISFAEALDLVSLEGAPDGDSDDNEGK